MDTLKILTDQLIVGQADQVSQLTRQSLEEGFEPLEILNSGLIPGMDEVGRRFKEGEMYVPDVLIAARAMRAGMDVLRPLLTQSEVPSLGTVLLGTIQGDLHDIGKNLVGIMLEGAGFEVIDLGVDVSPQRFVEAVQEHQPRIIGMSALLTVTMMGMKKVLMDLQTAGLRDRIVAMVGGAPVTQAFAQEIGADGYAHDAVSAVSTAKDLVSQSGAHS
jgi:5-methyltetrahydrofolate--homocysteine methyltransferase